jgi:hypothetical protein
MTWKVANSLVVGFVCNSQIPLLYSTSQVHRPDAVGDLTRDAGALFICDEERTGR